jgi:hypothetical protein
MTSTRGVPVRLERMGTPVHGLRDFRDVNMEERKKRIRAKKGEEEHLRCNAASQVVVVVGCS